MTTTLMKSIVTLDGHCVEATSCTSRFSKLEKHALERLLFKILQLEPPGDSIVHIYPYKDQRGSIHISEVSWANAENSGGASMMVSDPDNSHRFFCMDDYVHSITDKWPDDEVNDAEWRLNEVWDMILIPNPHKEK